MKPNETSDEAKTELGDILIIDDVPDNLRFLSDLLTEAKYKVRKVTNGEMGLEAALLDPPDLILLDVKMPGMNGYEVCGRLKASERTGQIPVIFLSALDEEINKILAFEAGGVDYILKPFQMVEVLARITTHLKISRLQSQLQQKNTQLQQEIERHSSAEAALQILNQGIEASVRDRTLALEVRNEQLLNLQVDLQDALAQEQRLNALKSQWISALSRDFRTPMALIMSAIKLLKREDRTPEFNRHVQIIEENVESMTQVLQSTAILADLEAEEFQFNPSPLDLTEFCRSFVRQWALPKSPEYQLLFVHWGRPPDAVLVDRRLLQQICSQLVSNAIRYSPNGGSILFELAYESDQATIRIRDEGIGIPTDDLGRVFDQFYRAKNADFVGGSAGLGLALVKQATLLHKGSIAVSSELGKGSTFTVSLPIAA